MFKILGLILLVIIAGGGFFYMKLLNGENCQITTPVNHAVIAFTSTGLQLSCITIMSGASITWVNNTKKEVAVGADPHPIHTGNREVSGGRFELDIAPGQQSVVTMQKKGRFGYHDHEHF